MSDDDGERRSYHHGNLREALVEAALDLIAKAGPNGFTFAEVARAAGVSPAAPYRHYKDRDALMAEIARQGFHRLADRLETAWEGSGPSPMRAFEAVGTAYLNFAHSDRPWFLAMFQSGVARGSDPDLTHAADRAFAALIRATEGLVRHLPADRRPPVHMMAYHVWALAHGTAELFGGLETSQRRSPISAEDLLEAGSAIYLRGLGLLPQG